MQASRLAVRHGSFRPREALTSARAVEVTAPRANDKRAGPATSERMNCNEPPARYLMTVNHDHGLGGCR
jgi:hypothetical protein